jgi:hypothetical protein
MLIVKLNEALGIMTLESLDWTNALLDIWQSDAIATPEKQEAVAQILEAAIKDRENGVYS